MTQPQHLVVVGQGAAGLAAAIAAAEATAAANSGIRITMIDKAGAEDAGGNTRWSPSNMRMASPDRVETSFVRDMMEATAFRGDERYFTRLAEEAPAAVRWLAACGVEFVQPPYYLAKGPPRIAPVGGGPALITALMQAAKTVGVDFLYNCVAQEIIHDEGGVTGLAVEQEGTRRILAADAIVLARGGFQGNADMMRMHFDDRGPTMRLISPGTRFATGDGIRMAQKNRRRRLGRLGRRARRAGRCARKKFRAGGAGLSVRHRGGPDGPPLVRRRWRTDA